MRVSALAGGLLVLASFGMSQARQPAAEAVSHSDLMGAALRGNNRFIEGPGDSWHAPSGDPISLRLSSTGSLEIATPQHSRLASISWSAFGRSGVWSPVVEPVRQFGRNADRWPMISFGRPGAREWYVNGADGLRQWFQIDQRPGSVLPGSLQLRLNVQGAQPVAESANSIRLAGSNVRYSDIKAWDSRGRSLPATLDASGSEIILEVDDSAAAYPVTIDPIWAYEDQEVALISGFDHFFGYSVSVHQGRAAISAPFATIGGKVNVGYVGVYRRDAGNWVLEQEIRPPSEDGQDRFGYDVCIFDNKLLIGEPGYGPSINSSGAAHLYSRGGFNWSLDQTFTPSNPQAFSGFGEAVALTDMHLIVGAPHMDFAGLPDQGLLYEWKFGTTSYQGGTFMTANTNGSNYKFGFDVALNDTNDYMIVGKPGRSFGSPTGEAELYKYTTSWIHDQSVAASVAGTLGLGHSVDISANAYVVGNNSDRGEIVIADWTGSGYSPLTRITNPFNDFSGFGNAVATHGEEVIVASPASTVGGQFGSGKISILTDEGSGWQIRDSFGSSAPQQFMGMGSSLDYDRSLIVAGAPNYDGTNDQEGRAFFYLFLPEMVDVSASPNYFAYDKTSTGTLTISRPAPPGDLFVNTYPSSSRGSIFPFARVLGGDVATIFDIENNVGDGVTSPTVAWNFKAIARVGDSQRDRTMTVIPAYLNSVKFQYNPTTYNRTVNLIIRTTWAAPSGSGGWNIALSSTDQATVQVPATAAIPEGSSYVVVPVTIGNGNRSRFITVKATLGGRSRSERIYLNP